MRTEADVRERLDACVATVLRGQERDKATMDAIAEQVSLLCWVLGFDDAETISKIATFRFNNRRFRE